MNINWNIENLLLNTCLVITFLVILYYWVSMNLGTKLDRFKIGSILMFILNGLFFCILLIRGYNSHHFPLSNLHTTNKKYYK